MCMFSSCGASDGKYCKAVFCYLLPSILKLCYMSIDYRTSFPNKRELFSQSYEQNIII